MYVPTYIETLNASKLPSKNFNIYNYIHIILNIDLHSGVAAVYREFVQ